MPSDTLYVFGDQSAELLPSIQELTRRSRHCEPLRNFLRTATDKVQQALAITPAHTRPQCPPFDSILQLAEAVSGHIGCSALVSTLLSISQLGNFVLLLVSNPRALEPSSCPTFFGICTGSFVAAAAASCHNLTEFVSVAPHIVTITYHLGLEASKRSWLLEQSYDSWATTISNVRVTAVQDAVASFNISRGVEGNSKVYLSATFENSVTISGPPSILKTFLGSTELFQTSRKLELPIRAAFHAKHLPPIALSRITNHVPNRPLERSIHHPLVSSTTGRLHGNSTLDHIIRELAHEVLQEPIDWQVATHMLSESLAKAVTLLPVGPFGAMNALRQALIRHEIKESPVAGSTIQDHATREGSGSVAVVGMSIRLPGSETLEEFWHVLEQGRDLHEKIRADRFDLQTHFDATGKTKNTSLTPWGVFIDRPGYFDPRFFNMSPREALQTDPQQRLMLLTTYEALEHAGYTPNRTPSTNTRRIASFLGQTGDDYREVNAGQDIDTYFVTGGIRAFGPGRVNYHFGWEGPSFSLDTACSSSAGSIQLACSALLARECDTAVGGGANLLTNPDLFAGLSRGSFLSKSGGCKTFDDDADGYVRADGCGVVILKRLEDAMADRDNILAVIRATATNHSAEAVSITHPHNMTQQRLFKTVLNQAGISPGDIDYAELHGTGTQAGDATESRSVTGVLCQGRSPSHPLYIGTVKPNLGHAEAASGVTSLIKAILMLQKDSIPPHIGIKGRINQRLPPLEALNTRISFGQTPFLPRSSGDGKRRILINNFDAAGGNTSILIEDPPHQKVVGIAPPDYHVVALSAKTTTALTNNVKKLSLFLKSNTDARLEDVAYSTTARRMHHNIRKAFSIRCHGDLVAVLDDYATSTIQVARIPTSPGIVFCFGGQGSQYVSMGATLYAHVPAFRDLIDDYVQLCVSHGLPSFISIITGEDTKLDSPVETQLAIIAVELANASLWTLYGVSPKAVIGHSLGEYAALCYAGVLSTSDCFYLVGTRASLLLSKCTANTHSMIAVRASAETVRQTLERSSLSGCDLACLNAPESTTVSGIASEINELAGILECSNIQTTLLNIPFAFHSAQIEGILEELTSFAEKITFREPKIPVASTLLGQVVTDNGIFGPQYLKLQTRNPVLFADAVNALEGARLVDEKTVFVDVGPTPTCLSMIKATLDRPNVFLPTMKPHETGWKVLSSSIAAAYNAGLSIDWSEYCRPFEASVRLLQLPNYSFDLKNYWMQYTGKRAWAMDTTATAAAGTTQRLKAKETFLSTSSLHRIEEQSIQSKQIIVMFAADAADIVLNKALSGHLVNGVRLCSSSVYADMAFTAAAYVHKLSDQSQPALDVCNMEVHTPLIIRPGKSEQVIRITAVLNRASREVRVSYKSQDGQQNKEHAHCLVRCGDGEEWKSEWSRHAHLVQERMANLARASLSNNAHKLLRPIVYKLFAGFVDYSESYQGMEEVYMDSQLQEATANIKFRSEQGQWHYSPYWIDSISHLSGFVLNGSDTTPRDSVFISHGWSSMKIVGLLSAGKQYKSYVRMLTTKKANLLSGDLYLFDGEDIVGLIRDLKFQRIRRSVLDQLIPAAHPITPAERMQTRAASRPPASPSVKTRNTRSDLSGPNFGRVLEVIAQDVSIEVTEFDDDTLFSDLGIDSLLTISILKSLNEELGRELSPSLFLDNPSVRDLRAFLKRTEMPAATTSQSSHQETSELVASTKVKRVTYKPAPTFNDVLDVIAAEVGTDPGEFDEDTLFADFGIDSLLTISIISRLEQKIGQELPATLFMENPAVHDLRAYLSITGGKRGAFEALERSTNEFSSGSENESISGDDMWSGHATPGTEGSDYSFTDVENIPSKIGAAEMIRRIIASEVGVSPAEIEPDVPLAELGVDSLLSLSIMTRIKDQTGMVLSPTFLVETQTFSNIQRALGGSNGGAST